ncbi:MAG: sugar phosphate nucleotidyltransferase, partial [Chlamydiota bacterium]
IASLPVEEAEAQRMGLLKSNDAGRVEDFFEKPTDPETLKRFALPADSLNGHKIKHPKSQHYLGSMGIYIFKRSALFALLKEEGDDFGKDLIPKQLKMGKTSTYVYKGYWEDIGTIASFFEANLALINQEHCLDTYNKHNPIFTLPFQLPSPLIKETFAHRAIISQGAIVEAKEVVNSILGVRVTVKKGTVIRNTIVLGNLFYEPPHHQGDRFPEEFTIGENCLIENAIIDEHSCVGNNVQLININKLQHYDGNGIFIRDGIIIVTSGTKVPDGFVL